VIPRQLAPTVGIATTGFRYSGGIRRVHHQQYSDQIREENRREPVSNLIRLRRVKEETCKKKKLGPDGRKQRRQKNKSRLKKWRPWMGSVVAGSIAIGRYVI
jgi:hypothetical protein